MKEEQVKQYNKAHCWQYDIRLNNFEDDVKESGLSEGEIRGLRCSDFILQQEPKESVFTEVKLFIERHEWLGKVSLYPTHFFTARYKGRLAGVVIMDMPVAFSKLLGEDTKKLERLISRGACVSWSPKNLASKLIMFAINWMVHNTPFRLFTAYSDTEARELGTIYQACNFYYLGRKSGAGWQYKLYDGRLVSDRYFRSRSVYKRLAKADGIFWQASWQVKDKVRFDLMPDDIAKRIKQLSKDYQNSCDKRPVASKHKYAYVQGIDKRETKRLKKLLTDRNAVYDYPKNRNIIDNETSFEFVPATHPRLEILKPAEKDYEELNMFD